MRLRLGIVTGLAVATALIAGAGATAWTGHRHAEQRDAAVRHSLAAAGPAAKAIFSYDYRTFDNSVTNGRLFVTGSFADEYTKTTAALKPTATADKAVVLAEVSASAVVNATPDKVEVLLYLNQYRRNVHTDGEKVDQNRVVLTMVPIDGVWKVSQAAAI
jgi:Mce-associated membrane protein